MKKNDDVSDAKNKFRRREKPKQRENRANRRRQRLKYFVRVHNYSVFHEATNRTVVTMIFLYLILAVILLLYVFFTWNFDYWSKRGVPSAKATILLGNLPNAILRREHLTYDFDKIYAYVLTVHVLIFSSGNTSVCSQRVQRQDSVYRDHSDPCTTPTCLGA